MEDFDWNESKNVVIPRVEAIAIYLNPEGELVIRQQHMFGEGDQVIVIPRDQIGKVIEAITVIAVD